MNITTTFPDTSVSIVIPTFNCVEMLKDALNSIYTQTLPQQQIQIIVIDDGSTDTTWKYLLEEQKSRSNLLALHQENSGHPSVGRNRGILNATNDFIFFLDSDDWFGPESLERLLRAAVLNNAEMVLGKQVGQNRTVNKSAFASTIADADIVDDKLWQVLSPCRLISRDLITRLGISFPEDMAQGEDQVFISQCYFGANRISVLADYDYYFVRGREDGTNLSRRLQTLENKRLTVTRMSRIILANTEPGERRRMLFHRVIFRTLAPALGKPFRNAASDEQQLFLDELCELVFPNMDDQDLSAASDVSRLRLTCARRGRADDLLELDRLLTKGSCITVHDERIVYDLGEHLNTKLPLESRKVTDSLPFKPTLTAIEPSSDQALLRADVGAPLIEGLGMDIRLEARLRDGSVLNVYPSISPQSGSLDSVFAIPHSALFETNGSKSKFWDMSIVIMEHGHELAREKLRHSPVTGRTEQRWTSENVEGIDGTGHFWLHTTKRGFISLRATNPASPTLGKNHHSHDILKEFPQKTERNFSFNSVLNQIRSIMRRFMKN